MANRTAKDAKSIKGTNPQYLVEKIIRTRIYDCKYWKEECFGITSELLVDRAMELDHFGGVYGGNIKPTPFLCLVLKMLQIQPNKDIIIEFIRNPDYKYVRVLGAMYLRLVGGSLECYNYLEPLYNDYRKLKRQNRAGEFELVHVDEFIDELLLSDRVCDIILPRIQKRHILEQTEQLEPRVSALEEDLSDVESEEEEEEGEGEEIERSPPHRHRSRSPSPHHNRDKHRHRSRSRSPHRRGRSRSPRSRRRRSHSRSPRRHRHRSPSHSPPRQDSHRHGHGRKRSRSRSKSRSPSPSHRRSERDHRDRERGSRTEREREKSSKSEKKSEKKGGKKMTAAQEEEIRQANEMRAKLGLKPLRV